MNNRMFQMPLSPPISPGFAGFPSETKLFEHQQRLGHYPVLSASRHTDQVSAHKQHGESRSIDSDRLLPNLPHSDRFWSQGVSIEAAADVSGGQYPVPSQDASFANERLSTHPHAFRSTDMQNTSFERSTAGTPEGQLTPESSSRDRPEDDDLVEYDADEQDDEGPERELTAAERRALKRKMKRFRLTHSQTRFLMNEFARQAHPDAAHRERLSREIPGLSPRQVQVWFQNRRAKLKRLTAEDQERMMKSRALPANFDMTHALHSPYGGQPPNVGITIPTTGPYVPNNDANTARPMAVGVPDYNTFAQQYASPVSQSPGAFAANAPSFAKGVIPLPSNMVGLPSYGMPQQRMHDSPMSSPHGLMGISDWAAQNTHTAHDGRTSSFSASPYEIRRLQQSRTMSYSSIPGPEMGYAYAMTSDSSHHDLSQSTRREDATRNTDAQYGRPNTFLPMRTPSQQYSGPPYDVSQAPPQTQPQQQLDLHWQSAPYNAGYE